MIIRSNTATDYLRIVIAVKSLAVARQTRNRYAKHLQDQNDIEQQHHRSRNHRCYSCESAISELTHDVNASSEDQERDHRKRPSNTEHDLTDSQRIRRMHAKSDNNESRYHRYQPPNHDRDPEPDKALHYHLAGHSSNRRAR